MTPETRKIPPVTPFYAAKTLQNCIYGYYTTSSPALQESAAIFAGISAESGTKRRHGGGEARRRWHIRSGQSRFAQGARREKQKKDIHTDILLRIGVTGLEPAASWSRTKHSTKLSHTPIEHRYYTTAARVCQGDLQSFFGNVRKFHPAPHSGRAHGIMPPVARR